MIVNGVNFFGPYEARDSIGRVATLNIECLKASGTPCDIHLLSRPGPKEVVDYANIDDDLIASLKHRVNIFHFNARRVPLYFSRLGKDSLKGFYNIGFWVHEMPTIPSQWARQLEFFDEIWTPSSLCQSAVSLSANIPVVKMPYPIEDNPVNQRMLERAAGQPFDVFNFLAIFDVFSDAERKNPLFVIRAFLEAHAGNPAVRLIMKTRNLDQDKMLAEKLHRISNEHKNVTVLTGYMEPSELRALYDSADAYVSLHRAEGFGLTISDAMSRGIPVLVTGYSGNMDFCNGADSRLVAYELKTVGHNRPRYRHDDVWAEPDLDDAIEAFRDLVQNHRTWVKRAARARLRLAREFSIEAIGNLMQNRINLIGRNFFFPDDMNERHIDFEVGVSNTYGF
ncbi:glycosyltransferase [Ewingella americana]|uniref:Glycosyltransferase n=1 Tax=Ewingella americana TaxID=41202 RepID=A0A502GSD8_9GAMM|nr:glycosyltransferase [Ewingella americana]TPG64841.1 glycosyltransferase [Ewingella americana]